MQPKIKTYNYESFNIYFYSFCIFTLLMKQFLKHISAFALAFLMLFATFSFTINEHICGGVNVSMAIGVDADTCGMEVESNGFETPMFQKTPCCNDVTTFIQGQDELPSSQETAISTQTFIKAFVYSYIYVLPTVDQEKTVYKPYIPPPLVKDIQLLDETFLI
ncbi:HYC_CC_PP family protein [Kordia sp.]|uniref:HYC_CC_PP family protein n=1 Tax=Kordia sp. TaxID=1965332 RepID=UPI003B5C517F